MKVYQNSRYNVSFESIVRGNPKGEKEVCLYSAEQVWDLLKNVPLVVDFDVFRFSETLFEDTAIYTARDGRILFVNIERHINVSVLNNKTYWKRMVYEIDAITRDNHKIKNKEEIIAKYHSLKQPSSMALGNKGRGVRK